MTPANPMGGIAYPMNDRSVAAGRASIMAPRKPATGTCEQCGGKLPGRRRLYCSDRCYARSTWERRPEYQDAQRQKWMHELNGRDPRFAELDSLIVAGVDEPTLEGHGILADIRWSHGIQSRRAA